MLGSASTRPGRIAHPLGPALFCFPAEQGTRARLIAVVILGCCIATLAVSATLDPDPDGMGTHRQLGLPTCGFAVMVGYPCPTCGMTTAFAHTVRGELGSAFRAHPGGLALALVAVLASGVCLSVVITGRVWSINWYRVSPIWTTVSIVAIFLGGWVYKLTACYFSRESAAPDLVEWLAFG